MARTRTADLVEALRITGALGADAEALVVGEGLEPVLEELARVVRRVGVAASAQPPQRAGVVQLVLPAEGALPFREGELDAIVIGSGIALALDEAARVTRDHGLLAVVSPSTDPDEECHEPRAHWQLIDRDEGGCWCLLRRRPRRAPAPPLTPETPRHRRCIEPEDPVLALCQHLPEPLVVVDGGCRGGFHERWLTLGPHAHLVGFDPDSLECERLGREMAWHPRVTLVDMALGTTPGPATFHIPEEPAGASLLPPDLEGTAHLGSVRGAQPDRVVETMVVRLDDWVQEAGLGRVDAFKLDVEGGELLAIGGAPDVLEHVSAVEVEVRFNRNNVGAPLFGEVDSALREHGFVLWAVSDPAHYRLGESQGMHLPDRNELIYYQQRDGEVVGRLVEAPPGQLIWANVHWVREAAVRPVAMAWDERLRFAIVARALAFHDLAAVNLRYALRADPPPAAASAISAALVAATS